MAYASRLDLEKSYGTELVDTLADHNGDGEPDPGTVEEATRLATSIIDAYIGVKYEVPLTEYVPVVVRDLAVDIAMYRLAHNPLKRTLEMRQRFDDAIDLLKRISEGKAVIALDTTGDDISDDQLTEFKGKLAFLNRA